jgi:thiol-disulfide isomerase/thioredoxin
MKQTIFHKSDCFTQHLNKRYMKIILCVFAVFILSGELIAQQDTSNNTKRFARIVPKIDSVYFFEITKKIHDLKLVDFNNNLIRIDTDNANCTVINIWATWCPPCLAEIPAFNAMKKKYKKCKVDFLAVSYLQDTVRTKEYLKSHPYTFKQVLAGRDYMQKNRLVSGLPTTLFIDRKGNVVFNFSGGYDDPAKQEQTINSFAKGMELLGCH